MPTGGGKSITFQVPALAQEGICIVITPLIALMKDQVQNLRKRGIKALAVYSGMTRQEILTALENCIFGDYKFLYISPERLDTDIFRTKLRSMKVSMITVDESHCISQWGYDFRPAYLKIAEIRALLPGIPVLALTATATPEVVKDIQARLDFREENVFRMSFERKNLAYMVRQTDNKTQELLHILRKVPGSAIIYVRNRRRTKEITELLVNEDITADFYHAGLDNAVKDLRQKRWQSGEVRVMVATNAFGMGIDKPDVRIVLHLDLPDSLEAYFQEAGRAGRDGEKAYAVILYTKTDRTTLHRRVVDTFPDKEYILNVYEHLQYYYQMAMGDGFQCVREFNLEEFCRKFKYFPVPVDSALKILTQAGYLEYTDEQDNASRILFTIRRDELYKLREMGTEAEALIQMILRSYTGVFTDYAYISEATLSVRTGLTREQIYNILVTLTKRRIVDYIPHKKTPYIIYTRERQELRFVHIPPAVYEERKARYEARIKAMEEYVISENVCRSRMLLRYFGEKNEHNCGQCDVCLSHRATDTLTGESLEELKKKIAELLAQKPHTPAEIAEKIEAEKERVSEVIQYLLEEGEWKMQDGMETPESEKQKNDQKNFEIFKYDGLRAQRMGRPDYAVKCFTEALAIQEEFETMGYLSQLYIQMGETAKARELLEKMAAMEPHLTSTFLTLANVCFIQEDYQAMEEAANKAIAIEEGNAVAHYLLGKARKGQNDDLMTIAHLTKAITLKDDFIEARLLRAEALLNLKQYKEMMEDIDAVLAQNPEEETAMLLRGKVKESNGQGEEAEEDYKLVTEINPFNEQAYLYLGQLYINQKKLTEAIGLFDEAIELNPNFAEAYKERGRAKLLNGDKDGSVEDMKKSLELNPKEEAGLNGEFKNLGPKPEALPGIF